MVDLCFPWPDPTKIYQAVKISTMVSQSTEDRLRRIADFKNRVSALRATSKVYNLKSDKSITTLDSNTTNGSSAILQEAPHGKLSPNRRDVDSEKRDAEIQNRSSPVTPSTAEKTAMKKNPFDDSDDEDSTLNCPSPSSQRGEEAAAVQETVSLKYKKSPNPFNKSRKKSPKPFDDDDSSCSSCSSVKGSYDDDSFTDLANTFRKSKKGKKPASDVKDTTKPGLKLVRDERSTVRNASPRTMTISSVASSRNSDFDTIDTATSASNGNSESYSVDGALFSDFQDAMQGKKPKSLGQGKHYDGSEDVDAAEFTKQSLATPIVVANMRIHVNPFEDSDGENSNINSSPSSSQPGLREKMDLDDKKSPNPFDDDDSICGSCSSDKCSHGVDSCAEFAYKVRKTNSGRKPASDSKILSKPKPKSALEEKSAATKASAKTATNTSETSSRNSDFDTLESATAVSNGNSAGSDSVDGALFCSFQNAMQGKKASPALKVASARQSVNSGSSLGTSTCSSTQQEKKSVTFVDQSSNALDVRRFEDDNLSQTSPAKRSFLELDQQVTKCSVLNPVSAPTEFSSKDQSSNDESSSDPSFSSWQSGSSTEISFISSVLEEQVVSKSSAQLFAELKGNPFIDSDDEVSEVSKTLIEESPSLPPQAKRVSSESRIYSCNDDETDEKPSSLAEGQQRKTEKSAPSSSNPKSDHIVGRHDGPRLSFVSMQLAASNNDASGAKLSDSSTKGDDDSDEDRVDLVSSNTNKIHPALRLEQFTNNGNSDEPVSKGTSFQSSICCDDPVQNAYSKINSDSEVNKKEGDTSLASRAKENGTHFVPFKLTCKNERNQNYSSSFVDELSNGNDTNALPSQMPIPLGREIHLFESDDGSESACSVATSFEAGNALKKVMDSNGQARTESVIPLSKADQRTASVTQNIDTKEIETPKHKAKSIWKPKALCSLESSSSLGSSFDSTVDNDDVSPDNHTRNQSNKYPGIYEDSSNSNLTNSTGGVLVSDFTDVIRSKKVDALEKYKIRKSHSIGSMVFESSTADPSLASIPCRKSGEDNSGSRRGCGSKLVGPAEKLKLAKNRSKFNGRHSSAVGSDALGGSSLESIEESMEEEPYVGLKKALSKIQSVDYEEEDANHVGNVVKEGYHPIDEDSLMDEKPTDMKSHIYVPDGSCAISSLKDEKFENLSIMNEGSYGENDEVASVPRCPAPLELPEQELLMGSGFAGAYDIDEEVSYVSKGKKGRPRPTPEHCPVVMTQNKKTMKLDSRSEVPVHTAANNQAVLRDGSISTKDTILGRTIQVGNVDLAAERIYLESLRAQVHAELKVHVADEEIRLALDARLDAIRDFYKRKATVAQLKLTHQDGLLERAYAINTSEAAMSSRPCIQPSKSMPRTESFLPEKKGDPNKVENSKELLIDDQVVKSMSAPMCVEHDGEETDRTVSKKTHKFAFERAQEGIDLALKAANIPDSTPTRSEEVKNYDANNFNIDVDASGVSDEDDIDDEFEDGFDEIEIMDEAETSQTSIPKNIIADETFWEEDQIMVPSPSSHSSVEMKFEAAVTSAWAFFRFIDGLMFDSRVYDYKFQQLQEDPLYPYLNSLIGIADGGEDGYINENKRVMQRPKKEYMNQSPLRICHSLAREAAEALPKLQVICAGIGGRLGMQTIAVGPIKKPTAALLKSERKYEGNPLLVTDYCRVSLFVADIATLLALIEIVLSKYSSIVRRIKLSKLKSSHASLVGGYRDCKINVDIDGHICEIQVHLESLWNLKEESGYLHYKRCTENSVTLSNFDLGRTLDGLDRSFESDLIKAGEASVRGTPIDSLRYNNEEVIRDYSCLVSLYLHYGMPVRAEYTLRKLVKMRAENPNFGPNHAETILFLGLLYRSLKSQHKFKKASQVRKRITRAERSQRNEEDSDIFGLCSKDQCKAIDFVVDMIVDPSRRERKEEQEKADKVEQSRKYWLEVRRSYFR